MKSYTTTTHTNSIAPIIMGGVIVVLVILGLVIYGLWMLVSSQERNVADWWAVVATLLLIPAFLTGFWFGKTEVRGFLSGADKMLDRMSRLMSDVVTVRDTSRINVHNATKVPTQPGYTVVLPNVPRSMPPITYRELTSGDNATEDL